MINREIIIAEKLSKNYFQGKEEICVFKEIDFKIIKGEMIGLIGSSGSGKSTLLNILGLLDNQTSGKLYINGQDTKNFSEKEKTKIRGRDIGFIFQFHHLLPDFTSLENVMIPQLINKVEKKIAKERAIRILETLNLSHRLKYFPSMLSGGEQQRVAIARAIAMNPSLIIADEPTGNLDSHNAKEVFNLILSVVREYNISIIIATHDDKLASLMDKKIKLEDNKLIIDLIRPNIFCN